MSAPVHGGRIFALARQLNCAPGEILDYSASINPLGPPLPVLDAARKALDVVCHYPDPAAEPLAADLAAYHQLPPSHLLAGSGATEFIFAAPRALGCRCALVVEPAFAEYAVALQQAGCRINRFLLAAQDDFALSPGKLLAALTPETELLVLANPMNPVGAAFPRQQLRALLDAVPDTTIVLVDEAFVDFCPEFSIIDQVACRTNLLVMRSLTKFYAIPGLRVGYLAGSEALVRRVQNMREPWRLSTPAIAAARACLPEEDYRQQSLERISAWRALMARQLAALGCQVYPSQANYLLCRLPERCSGSGPVAKRLAERRILVRECANFVGLDERYLRLAVRLPEENQRLLKALSEALAS